MDPSFFLNDQGKTLRSMETLLNNSRIFDLVYFNSATATSCYQLTLYMSISCTSSDLGRLTYFTSCFLQTTVLLPFSIDMMVLPVSGYSICLKLKIS